MQLQHGSLLLVSSCGSALRSSPPCCRFGMDLVRIATLVRRTLGMQRGSVAHLRMVLKTNHLAGMVRQGVSWHSAGTKLQAGVGCSASHAHTTPRGRDVSCACSCIPALLLGLALTSIPFCRLPACLPLPTGHPVPSQERAAAQPRQAERAGRHHLLLQTVQRQGALGKSAERGRSGKPGGVCTAEPADDAAAAAHPLNAAPAGPLSSALPGHFNPTTRPASNKLPNTGCERQRV